MAPPIFLKPENAVKRAEELLEVSQPEEALTALHETLTSRRSKLVPASTLEPLAIKLIEICVQLRRSRVARDSLVQFKNMSQHTNVASIERVVKAFLDLSEARLREAYAETTHGKAPDGAADSIVAAVEDLETPETPEALLYASVNLVNEQDRSDRVVLMPWLKFLWEAYRTVLDVLRNNARLELLYQQTAAQAFAFCLRFKRKNEFRRLCDNLRNHLSSIPRFTHQNSITLSDPEVLQRFLDTRFVQLQTATDLELWQESFRSVEDIYQLLIMAGSLIAPNTPENPQLMAGLLPAALFTNKMHGPKMMQMLAQYYEKLTRIFAVSGDGLFLAASWNKYHTWVTHMKSHTTLTDDEHSRLAANTLLSALAVPVINTSATTQYSTATSLEELVNSTGSLAEHDAGLVSNNRSNRKARLAAMLGLNRIPTRIALVQEAISKSVLSRVSNDLRKLYQLMEVTFHPLTAAKHVGKLLETLSADKNTAKYIDDIRHVVVTKILKEVSMFYTTISIESLVEIVSMPGCAMTASKLERIVVQGNLQRDFRIRVNHLTGTFDFVVDPIVEDPANVQQTKPLHASCIAPSFDHMRYELTKFTKCLHTTLNLFEPERRQQLVKQRQAAFAAARDNMEAEHRQALERKLVIERRKEIVETIQQKREAEEAYDRAIRAEREKVLSQARIIEENKQRELQKLLREQEEIKRAEAKKLADSLKTKANITIKDEDLDRLDAREVLAVQVEQIEREKQLQEVRLRSLSKRLDHMERACRQAEIPLLEAKYGSQKIRDKEAHYETRRHLVEETKTRHVEAVEIKKRVTRMLQDYKSVKETKVAAKREQLERAKIEARDKIEAEKAERREEARMLIVQRREEIARIEEEERQREEEEIARIKEEEREMEKLRQRQERDRAEYEAFAAKQDEIMRRQREKEQEIESRYRRGPRPSATPPSSGIKKWATPVHALPENGIPANNAPRAASSASTTLNEESYKPSIQRRSEQTPSTTSNAASINSTNASPRLNPISRVTPPPTSTVRAAPTGIYRPPSARMRESEVASPASFNGRSATPTAPMSRLPPQQAPGTSRFDALSDSSTGTRPSEGNRTWKKQAK